MFLVKAKKQTPISMVDSSLKILDMIKKLSGSSFHMKQAQHAKIRKLNQYVNAITAHLRAATRSLANSPLGSSLVLGNKTTRMSLSLA